MDDEVFAVEAAVEATHWWFVGRRALLAREIARLGLARSARVIDVGTGTGAGLRLLRELGFVAVEGVDANDTAIRWCAAKNLGTVRSGDACSLPFADASVDLVCATDVIEHVENHSQALSEIARVLAPGRHALLTVPAFQSLWGLQDEKAHHKRRYRLRGLRECVENAGLTAARGYYFNYLLFVPIFIARQVIRAAGIELRSENEVNTPVINRVLTAIFRLDVLTAPYLHPPFGVSALIVARKPDAVSDAMDGRRARR